MTIADKIRTEYSQLNRDQLRAVGHTEGPHLMIAGPGSCKTLVLVVRALNILLRGLADPSELLLCTFTEKAASEPRDRISLAAKQLGYEGDLSGLLVGSQSTAPVIRTVCAWERLGASRLASAATAAHDLGEKRRCSTAKAEAKWTEDMARVVSGFLSGTTPGRVSKVPPARLERAHTASEAAALSA